MNLVTGILISLFLGFGPVFFFAYLVYWIDRYEKEPLLLLGAVFLWGAVVAAGTAFVVNTLLGLTIYVATGSQGLTDVATGSLFAPPIEETLKGFAVLLVFLIFRKEFDTILDGIVYASIAALGFAATENAFYIFSYGYTQNGFTGILGVAFVRVILVGWQHPFFTSFIGIGFAIARLNRSWAVKILAPLAGWILAILAHSLHNTLTTFLGGIVGLAATSIVDWSGWVLMFIFVLWALHREQTWIVRQLREEVNLGVISPVQYKTACSSIAQTIARMQALFSGKYLATSRFYQAAAELAFKKEQLADFGDENGNRALIERLRAELSLLSKAAVA